MRFRYVKRQILHALLIPKGCDYYSNIIMQWVLNPEGVILFRFVMLFYPFGVGFCFAGIVYNHTIPSGLFSAVALLAYLQLLRKAKGCIIFCGNNGLPGTLQRTPGNKGKGMGGFHGYQRFLPSRWLVIAMFLAVSRFFAVFVIVHP